MPAHCRPDPVAYIDALRMWGPLCTLETMLKARHLPQETELATKCKEICRDMMDGAQ
jgi:hypothetical protein